MATGAAIACPDRKVINLQADGSGLYTAQALWTQARENLNVLTLIWANRSYAVLKAELANVGANPGRKALDMLSLDRPAIDWVSLARGFGVEARRVDDLDSFLAAFQCGSQRPRAVPDRRSHSIETRLKHGRQSACRRHFSLSFRLSCADSWPCWTPHFVAIVQHSFSKPLAGLPKASDRLPLRPASIMVTLRRGQSHRDLTNLMRVPRWRSG
jgi:hypothetical protein